MAITVSKAGSAISVTSSHSLSDEDEEAEFEKNKQRRQDGLGQIDFDNGFD